MQPTTKKTLGARALELGWVRESDILEALKAQYLAKVVLGRHLFIGELLLLRGVLDPKRLVDLLRETADPIEGAADRVACRFFGDIAIDLGLCSTGDILAALDVQHDEDARSLPHRLVGEILFERGALTREQVDRVIARMHGAAPKGVA